jgi:ATP-dependent Clp protease ATP-binding subunit ClpA
VIVEKDETAGDRLGFEYLEGPVAPKPDKLPAARPKAKRKSPRPKPKGNGGGGKSGSVPKVPLVKA